MSVIHTAVILVARKERDCELPYPLMPLSDGRCLIQRTLDNLTQLGIDNIYMVVGYRADEFRRFESASVHVTVNPDYAYTASMGSLAVAAQYIKEDFLLVEGDVFYEKKVLKALVDAPYADCLSVTEESGNGDEAFVEVDGDHIVDISKDRHRILRIGGELLGVSRLSSATLDRMVQAYRHGNNPYVNYEYVFLDVTDVSGRPCLRFPGLIWGDVDCRADYDRLLTDIERKLCRKENPYDKATLTDYMAEIFGDDTIADLPIEPIGGMSNRNFKVTYNDTDYVLRVPGYGSEGMVVRASEEVLSRLTAQIGINTPVFYFNKDTGVKLTQYIAEAETLTPATIQRPENIRQVARKLRDLHTSAIPMPERFDLFTQIRRYEELLDAAGAQMYPGWQPVRSAVMALEPVLDQIGVESCPCHNDLVPENFIKDAAGRLYIIDWEYGGANDPVADLAAVMLEADFTGINADYLLECYYQGDVPVHTSRKILIYQILFDYLWAVWTAIKEEHGADFGTYGRDRFNRAIDNLKKLNML